MLTTEQLQAFAQGLTVQRARELARLQLENRALRALKDSLECQAEIAKAEAAAQLLVS